MGASATSDRTNVAVRLVVLLAADEKMASRTLWNAVIGTVTAPRTRTSVIDALLISSIDLVSKGAKDREMVHDSASAATAGRNPEYTIAEQEERHLLGLPPDSPATPGALSNASPPGRRHVQKSSVHAHDVLNEATDYPQPVSFSRGVRVDFTGPVTHLFLSGTASIGPHGLTLYPGDFRAQCWRAYRNLTQLLAAERATWHDVVRCTCYLRDIERDYSAFNEIRTEFFGALALDPLPASTGIQVGLCRSDLLVEIEVHAILSSSP